jgi:hypothetical protein
MTSGKYKMEEEIEDMPCDKKRDEEYYILHPKEKRLERICVFTSKVSIAMSLLSVGIYACQSFAHNSTQFNKIAGIGAFCFYACGVVMGVGSLMGLGRVEYRKDVYLESLRESNKSEG